MEKSLQWVPWTFVSICHAVGTMSGRGVIGAVSSRLGAFRNLELSVCRSILEVGTPCSAHQQFGHVDVVLGFTS
jgi:hypothetical protein